MKNMTPFVAMAVLAVGAGTALAAKGPKKPDTPFTVHVSAVLADKDAADSANDVRKVLEEKKRDWFRLTDTQAEADIVIVIVGREWTTDKAVIVRGRVTSANLSDAEIIGQCIPGILDITGPWKCAAGNMAKRLETFCRETYADLSEAQRKRTATGGK